MKMVLAHQRQNSIFPCSGKCHEPVGNLCLQHDHTQFDNEGVTSQVLQYRRGDVVGNVTNHFEFLRAGGIFFLELVEIHVQDVLIQKNGLRADERSFEAFEQSHVQLDAYVLPGVPHQSPGQDSSSAANFQNHVLAVQVQGANNLLNSATVTEKVLT